MASRWWALGVGGIGLAAAWLLVGGTPFGDSELPGTEAMTSAAAPTTSASPAAPPVAGQVAERRIADPEIDELSGLAASRLHPGVLYGINDSGGAPVVYAIDATGTTVARLQLDGITAWDWEALAPGWDESGQPVLWIGGIGDNRDNQQRVRLLRIAEPTRLVDQSAPFREYWITYADGPHNAEALLVHPETGEISVVTKGSGGPGAMYRPTGPLQDVRTNVLQWVMDVPASITDGAWELSPAGEPRLVLVDYWRIHRLQGSQWVSQLGPLQLQREALAWPWLPDAGPNDTVLVGSEGTNSMILTAQVP